MTDGSACRNEVIRMAKTNALTEWLNIPADQQPANHYRLLNLKKFTSDAGKINTAAEQKKINTAQTAKKNHQHLSSRCCGTTKAWSTNVFFEPVVGQNGSKKKHKGCTMTKEKRKYNMKQETKKKHAAIRKSRSVVAVAALV